MIFTDRRVTPAELERTTGWALRPEGLCRADRCVPFHTEDDTLEIEAIAEALGTPLVHDEANGLWALGAEARGRALESATAPELELPEAEGRPFRLSSLRGEKVLLVAWASW